MKIYLAYRREDIEIARQVFAYLAQSGDEVWAFFNDVPAEVVDSREKRRELRQQGLEKAELLVVLVSPSFEDSIGIAREIIYIQFRNRPILPVIVRPTEVPFSLLGTRVLDISDDITAGLGLISEEITRIKSEKAALRELSAPPSNEELRERLERILQETPPARIFIAYSHVQRSIAGALAELLIKNGKAVFYDAKIKAGASWRQTIQKALDDATHVVVVWTPEAAESDEVEREVSYALAERKVIVPILSKAVAKLPYHLHGLHHIMLDDNLATIEGDLLKALAQYAEDEDIWQ